MASLRINKSVSVGKPKCTQPILVVGEVLSLKGPGVTAVRLETERSSPGQGEARRKSGGGPKEC